MKPMKEIDVSAAVIVRKNEKGQREVLCGQRTAGHHKGKWEFPGGKAEAGETLTQTVVREIKEELGCAVCVKDQIASVKTSSKGKVINVSFFLCELCKGQADVVPVEYKTIAWLTRETLRTVDWLEADLAALKEVDKVLEGR